jgi:mono/diheme cytochrome c family protein
MRKIMIAGAAAIAGMVALASANAQTSAAAPVRSAPELFAAKCAACHAKGGWGTRSLTRRMPAEYAELLNRDAIPAAYVKHVVRRGISSMPQFTKTDLSDEELDRLAAWLETKR